MADGCRSYSVGRSRGPSLVGDPGRPDFSRARIHSGVSGSGPTEVGPTTPSARNCVTPTAISHQPRSYAAGHLAPVAQTSVWAKILRRSGFPPRLKSGPP